MNNPKSTADHTGTQYYKYLNEYYDKIYVITIPRATERQENIKKLLKGLDFEFFYGTDKNNWSIEKFVEKGIYNEQLSIRKHRYGKMMTLGEVAAACSHKQVYETIIQNNYGKVLIFEDDVIPDFSQLHFIPAILNELPGDWELFYWGYLTKYEKKNLLNLFKTYFYHIQHAIGFLKWTHKMIRNLQPMRKSRHISVSGFHDMIHAYAITKATAEKLLQWNTPVQYCADTGITYAILNEFIKSYIAHPALFYQEQQTNPKNYQSLIKQ